jgi:hypothetical protein
VFRMKRFITSFRNSNLVQRQNRITRSTSPEATYEYHAFISYTTREDEVRVIKPFIDEYVGILQAQGVRVCPVFYDGWYLRKRQYDNVTLEEELRQGIHQSAFTVAFLSPGYLTSNWCCFEWMTTEEEHRKRVFPAPSYSILPICWKKPLAKNYGNWCSKAVLSRPYSDISYSLRANPQQALTRAIARTRAYLDTWYPMQGWRQLISWPRYQ